MKNTDDKLYFYIYRGAETTNDEVIRIIVDELKNFVFSGESIVLSSKGYSGIPLKGEIGLNITDNELYKVLQILFKLSYELDDLVFHIETSKHQLNPIYSESINNDVIPKWAPEPKDFLENVFGYGGVLHAISPEISQRNPKMSKVEIIRKENSQTRNILITESVKQKLDSAHARNFGMQRTSINIPPNLAYIARQRPDLLSAAIREFGNQTDQKQQSYDEKMNKNELVMVHVLLNDSDWKVVTAVADIESPTDIVSYRIGTSLMAFDDKYSCIPNGLDLPATTTFEKVSDAFERERLNSIQAGLFGNPHSLSHMYQCAKSLTTSKHVAECRKVFVDDSSSNDQRSTYSGDEEDESYNVKYAKRQVFKKKRKGDLGRKRELAAVVKKSTAPETPMEELQPPTPTSSGKLKNFERAVNGDDVYYQESECDSLGEDEDDMELFVTTNIGRNKTNKTNLQKTKPCISSQGKQGEKQPESDDDGFCVADLLNSVPPLAKTDDFEDFDDI